MSDGNAAQSACSAKAPWSTAWSCLLRYSLLILIWIAFLDLPTVGSHGLLDDSWQEAYGYFLKHRLQAGVEYIFTFGPLGYFYTTAYDPDLFWLKFGWELAIKGTLAFVLVRIARESGWFPGVLLVLAALLFLAPRHRETTDAVYPFLIVATTALLLKTPANRIASLMGYAFLLAVLCQVKFSFTILSAGCLCIVVVYQLVSRQFRQAALVSAAFAGVFLGTWLLAGQSLLNLPSYLSWSFQIAGGYAEAMAIPGDPLHIALGLLIGVILVAVLFTFDLRHTPRWGVVALVLLCMLVFVLQWKHGFTRHPSHSSKFFTFCFLLPFIPAAVLTPVPRFWTVRSLLVGGCVLLAVIGIEGRPLAPQEYLRRSWDSFLANGWCVLAPQQFQERLQQARIAWVNALQLPRVRQQVGESSIDVFSCQQTVLFANGLKWKPRPVFQSYSAFTPALLEANAAFLRSADAPEYLLVRWEPIDDRVPASEDGLALLEILHRYQPVLKEDDYLLLKRPTGTFPSGVDPRVISTRTIRLDEEVALGGSSQELQTLRLGVRSTLYGKLRGWLYGPACLFFVARMEDGETLRYRLLPSLAASGFLINPFLRKSNDLLSIYEEAGPRLRSFHVEGDARYFGAEMGMTLAAR